MTTYTTPFIPPPSAPPGKRPSTAGFLLRRNRSIRLPSARDFLSGAYNSDLAVKRQVHAQGDWHPLTRTAIGSVLPSQWNFEPKIPQSTLLLIA
jgi:hypothetical protein